VEIPWEIINKYATKYNVDPYLIAAIGAHETRWGKLGAGRKGFHLGYGYPAPGQGDVRFQGLEKQVEMATRKMGRWGMRPGQVTLERLEIGNRGFLATGIYATDPNWPAAVFRQYSEIRTQAGERLGLGKIYQTQREYEARQAERRVSDEMRVEVPRPEGILGTVIYFVALLGIAAVGVVALYKSASGVKS